MLGIDVLSLVWLALAWSVWCALHSALIQPRVERLLSAFLGKQAGAYRLIYNLIAVATLLPVVFCYVRADATPLLNWPFWLKPVQWSGLCAAVVLTIAAGKVYNLAAFFGVHQLRKGLASKVSESQAELVVVGILRYTRHPWYLAGLLLLWCRDLSARDLLTSSVLTGYLLVGIHLEERKLLRQFGQAYERYRQQVPMLWGLFRCRCFPNHRS